MSLRLDIPTAATLARAWSTAKQHGIWVAAKKLQAELFSHGYLVKESRSGRLRIEEYPLGKRHRV